jgi:hypothetical protein
MGHGGLWSSGWFLPPQTPAGILSHLAIQSTFRVVTCHLGVGIAMNPSEPSPPERWSMRTMAILGGWVGGPCLAFCGAVTGACFEGIPGFVLGTVAGATVGVLVGAGGMAIAYAYRERRVLSALLFLVTICGPVGMASGMFTFLLLYGKPLRGLDAIMWAGYGWVMGMVTVLSNLMWIGVDDDD